MFEKYKALIFDMDGTLIDSGKVHELAWVETLKKYDIPVDRTLMRSLAGVTTSATLEKLIDHFEVIVPVSLHEMSSYKQMIVNANIVKHVKPTCLKALAENCSGKLPMNVGTGATAAEAETMLKHCGLRQLFAHVVGAESVGQPKPAPDTFLKCAELMGVSPSTCLVFEDAKLGLQAANAAGMHAIDVFDVHSIENNYFV